ncbi:zinc ribbon domain-containing protein [Rhodococcus sp. T2V]
MWNPPGRCPGCGRILSAASRRCPCGFTRAVRCETPIFVASRWQL